MRPRDRELGERLAAALSHFNVERRPLPGIVEPARRESLLEQLLESIHRVAFVRLLQKRELSPRRADPNDQLFDPLKAALLQQRAGNLEEAFWLVFLFVQFGKNAAGGWRYAREVYGRLGGPDRLNWAATSRDPQGFRAWLDAHQNDLKRRGVPGGFGNHRKYESLDARSDRGTGAAVETYVRWVDPPRTHREVIADALRQAAGDPRLAFDALFRSMRAVASFGRTARFDYLSMLNKLELAAITAGSAYIEGSTGPLRGARLLFGAGERPTTLDRWLVELDAELNVGMQVLEDALCNWQKSPDRFVRFRG